MWGNLRSRPNIRRTPGLTAAIKTGTTITTTHRSRCSLHGPLMTQSCVSALRTADVIKRAPLVLPAYMTPFRRPLLYPAMTMPSLSFSKPQNLHKSLFHLTTLDLLHPPVTLQAQTWPRFQQWGLIWCGSMENSRDICQG